MIKEKASIVANPQKKNPFRNKEEAKAKKQRMEKVDQKEIRKNSARAVINSWHELLEDED